MKIRMQGNSIRYWMIGARSRSTRATRRFKSSVQFPTGTLRYAVEGAPDGSAPGAKFGPRGHRYLLSGTHSRPIGRRAGGLNRR